MQLVMLNHHSVPLHVSFQLSSELESLQPNKHEYGSINSISVCMLNFDPTSDNWK